MKYKHTDLTYVYFECYRPNSLLTLLKSGLEKSDVIISTGGVSMGEKVSICYKMALDVYKLLQTFSKLHKKKLAVFINVHTVQYCFVHQCM